MALRYEQDGHVVVLTIDRPDRLNAVDGATHQELAAAWRRVGEDPEARAVVVTGAGDRGFCTGMDLAEAAEQGWDDPGPEHVEDAARFTGLQNDVWTPTVVAVNGVCAGAGLHFLADADVVLASEHASFVDTHVDVGQVTALEPIGLLHRIGLGNALRLAVLGRAGRLEAQEALRISLVDEVVAHDRLLERARELAGAAAAASPAAVEASKRAIWGALERPLSDALQSGWEAIRAHRAHPDATEGPRAFAEKRDPDWVPGQA